MNNFVMHFSYSIVFLPAGLPAGQLVMNWLTFYIENPNRSFGIGEREGCCAEQPANQGCVRAKRLTFVSW